MILNSRVGQVICANFAPSHCRWILDMLDSGYESTLRYYHTWHHINDVLDNLHDMAACDPSRDPLVYGACMLGAVFHDLVYVPGFSGNETLSANILREIQYLALDDAAQERIRCAVEAIRGTSARSHGYPSDEQKILHDADWAVLGKPGDEYQLYSNRVRMEFMWQPLSEAAFNAGRAKFLKDTLDKPAIYMTQYGLDTWEKKARENMTQELASLTHA